MNRLILFLFLALASTTSFGQKPARNETMLAERQIMMLKNGTLVVSLKNNERSIKAYRNAGNEKLASKLELGYREINLNLVKAFLQYYNFSRVLFIYTSDIHRLLDHEPYVFRNENLEIDSSIYFSYDSFFIAEYGTLLSTERADAYSYQNKGTVETDNASSTSAIVLMDTSLTQLKEPFPFYSEVFLSMGFLAPNSHKNISASNTNKDIAPQIEQPLGGKSKKRSRNSLSDSTSVKNVYDKAIKRLNAKLIGYFVKVSINNEHYALEDPEWWRENNPNTNLTERLRLVNEALLRLEVAKAKLKDSE